MNKKMRKGKKPAANDSEKVAVNDGESGHQGLEMYILILLCIKLLEQAYTPPETRGKGVTYFFFLNFFLVFWFFDLCDVILQLFYTVKRRKGFLKKF